MATTPRSELIEDARELARVSRELRHGAPSHADTIDELADALEVAKAEVARLEAENAELRRENRKLLVEGEPHRRANRRYKSELRRRFTAETARDEYRAERDALAAVLAEVRAWNERGGGTWMLNEGRSLASLLSVDPSEVLRARDEKTWDEGHTEGAIGTPARVNPYRRVQEGDHRG